MKTKGSDIAVRIESVSKNFRLPHERADSIKSVFVNPFAARKGRVETQRALHNITFDIKKGEFFGIVGRNGSGKSTLLKLIAGIYQPNGGNITVDGRLVPFIELGVGFNPELTGRENVYMNGALMGFSDKEVGAKLKDIIKFAELERFMDQKLKNYSSGMQVRLAFSVATILAESDILLIDEVLAVGDADFQRKCFDYFKKLKRAKKTVIFVSHDMNAVREYCDRAVLIDDSKVVFSGTSEDTAKEYMRLFLPEQYKIHKQQEEEALHEQTQDTTGKWGSGGAFINAVTFEKKVLTQADASLVMTVEIQADADFPEGLVYGMTIKNQQGEGVVGTNSRIVRRETKEPLKKGDIRHVTWTVPNIFNEGTYLVEPALSEPDTMDVVMWWDDAAEFFVENDEKTPYKVAPKVKLKVTKS